MLHQYHTHRASYPLHRSRWTLLLTIIIFVLPFLRIEAEVTHFDGLNFDTQSLFGPQNIDTDGDGIPDVDDLDDDNDGISDEDELCTAPNLITNWNFEDLPAGPFPAPAGADLGGWSSGLICVENGTYPRDTRVSVQTGAIKYAGGIVNQVPFPGDPAAGIPALNNYLYANGNNTGGPYVAWEQVVAVEPNTTYTFAGYFSNCIRTGADVADDPVLSFNFDGANVGGLFRLRDHSDPVSGDGGQDLWKKYQVTFTTGPGQTQVTVQLRDNATGSIGDDWAVTALQMRQEDFIPVDSDGDGLPNCVDLDSDNDGIPDIVEAAGVDRDGDGMVDNFIDVDADGLTDIYDPIDNGGNSPGWIGGVAIPHGDFDGDGVPNERDLDSDQDGIVDALETFGIAVDADQDGQVDGQAASDADGNGWHDLFQGRVPTQPDSSPTEYANNVWPDFATGPGQPDFDGDGLPNFIDLEADGDGIVDLIESQPSGLNPKDPFDGLRLPGGGDANQNGWLASFDPAEGGTYIVPINTDNQDGEDYLDLDTDSDGILDIIEGHDADMDGQADRMPDWIDIDQDGLDDAYDTDLNAHDILASNQSVQDTDNNLGAGGDRDWRDIATSFPVEWLSFDAAWQAGTAQLRWATAQEVNSDYFEVQRSTDGEHYEKLGSLGAAGNSDRVLEYEYQDAGAAFLPARRIYYRLRQVDLDGSFSYSKVVELHVANRFSARLAAFPNPTQGLLHLRWTPWQEEGTVRCLLINSMGQVVRRRQAPAEQRQLTWDLTPQTAGTYTLLLVQGGQRYTRRVVVQ